MGRRAVISWTGAGVVLGAATAGGAVAALRSGDDVRTAASQDTAVAFHGTHQAGITTAVQDRLHFAAFDITAQVPQDSWYGTLLKGVFNFQADPTVLQVTVWAPYVVPTMILFLAPGKVAPTAAAPKEPKPDDSQVPLPAGRSSVDADGSDDDRVRDGARGAGTGTGGEEG